MKSSIKNVFCVLSNSETEKCPFGIFRLSWTTHYSNHRSENVLYDENNRYVTTLTQHHKILYRKLSRQELVQQLSFPRLLYVITFVYSHQFSLSLHLIREKTFLFYLFLCTHHLGSLTFCPIYENSVSMNDETKEIINFQLMFGFNFIYSENNNDKKLNVSAFFVLNLVFRHILFQDRY